MKALNSILMTAAVAGFAVNANAQFPGAACGCPPVASRTTVNVSTLLTGGNLANGQVWDCSKTYVLDQNGPAYVAPNGTLTIQPGTIIKGSTNSGLNASSLVVPRGSQIFAEGTAACQIVFTSVNDIAVNGTYPVTNTSQWGSLIVLGRAQNNLLSGATLANGDGEGRIEGLDVADPRNLYGVNDGTPNGVFTGTFINNDNSGVLRHVSLRHGGVTIGNNNEINGLTMGSVGNGTVVENIEIVANEDDGIECFGGTVNIKFASMYFCQDDAFDVDQAYTGNMQFMFALQGGIGGLNNALLGDHILELDGDDSNQGVPIGFLGNPRIFNVTGIGNLGSSDPAVEMKENFRGTVANSIFSNAVWGIRTVANSALGAASFEAIEFFNNTFDGITVAPVAPSSPAETVTYVNSPANNNITANGTLPDVTFSINDGTTSVQPVPVTGAVGAGNASTLIYAGIQPTTYRGAFAPGQVSWIAQGFLSTPGQTALGNQPNGCRSDLNGDGLINTADLSIFGGDFSTGTCN